jgi:integrating conjugative element protein (TIGR03757 family)
MLSLIRISLGFVIMLFQCTAASAEPTLAVTYIGTNNHSIVNAEAVEDYDIKLTVFNIDAHRNLEKQLSENLPSDITEAERIANERLAALDAHLVQDAFKGIALSLHWDLKTVPAIVFGDGEQVIYGVTDMNVALKRYHYFNTRTR